MSYLLTGGGKLWTFRGDKSKQFLPFVSLKESNMYVKPIIGSSVFCFRSVSCACSRTVPVWTRFCLTLVFVLLFAAGSLRAQKQDGYSLSMPCPCECSTASGRPPSSICSGADWSVPWPPAVSTSTMYSARPCSHATK